MKIKYRTFSKLLLPVTVFFLAGACQNLEEDLRGVLVADSYFKTEQDIHASVNAVIRELQTGGDRGIGGARFYSPHYGADDITTDRAGNKEPMRQFDQFNANSSNGEIRTTWSKLYKIIQTSNNVIENYSQVTGEPAAINQAAAPAYWYRAFAYFYLVRLFGEVPLVTSVTPDLRLVRSSQPEIYQFILQDLAFAEEHLPVAWSNDFARPNKWAAQALLAEVYLTMAGYPLRDQSKYALAAAKAREVIDGGAYQLLPDFAGLWRHNNQNNKEVIFAFQFCASNVCGPNLNSTLTGNATKPFEEGGWEDLFPEINFFLSFPEGPRKAATFITEFKKGNQLLSWDSQATKQRHPYYAKYRDGGVQRDPLFPNFENVFQTGRDQVYFRLADVLLMYAEAQAMASGPDATAYQAINQVRKRAGLPDLTEGLGQTAFRDSVIAERGWELAAEFKRWFDLVRTEKIESANADKHPNDMILLEAPDKNKHYLAPLPGDEIQRAPQLTQNPGY